MLKRRPSYKEAHGENLHEIQGDSLNQVHSDQKVLRQSGEEAGPLWGNGQKIPKI